MKCPKCCFENPDGMKFCGECGSKLEKICSKCGFSNPPQHKFCGECGQKLSEQGDSNSKALSFEQKLVKIQRYLPQGITEKILSEKQKIEGERKQVTVLFCDMEGFTSFVEECGSEESYNIMDEVYEILIHKVHDYGGTVNEMTGDGVMALFGAPIALEDAPQRSIRSALAIHREMAIFSDRIKQTRAETRPVKMRIGINTGPVVVGSLGNDLRVDFKAVGDTVNLASRLSDLSDPGASFVTESTFKLTKGLFRFEALGEKPVKGKKDPVKIYRVLSTSSRRTRFDVSAESGLTPFVSRERELTLLVDGFERMKEGRGKAFSILSDAGVGKSRLLYEFRKAIANEYVTFLEGKCLSYSSNVPYHPIVDILKSNFDIDEKDSDSKIIKKAKKGLKLLGADEVSTLPYILELLSIEEIGVEKIALSPEAKKDRITEAFKRIVLRGSEIRPLILAFEDLHWMDNSSEEILKHLLDSIPASRILMIFTYRPTFVCTWTGKSFHSQLTLNRLSEKESHIMLSYLIGEKALDSNLSEIIFEKTEGVPFFIEEFVNSFKDMNIIEKKGDGYILTTDPKNVAIPSTIHDVIMARVDSLPESAKDLIQAGSVVEREFDYALIKKIVDLPEQELLSNLAVLKDTELLYERGIYPECTYIFKHALTREVIYDSILSNRKKKIHEKIGNAIEDLYQEKIEEHYGVLTEHYMASENYEKAAEYSTLAAGASETVGSLNDAIAYSEKAVWCLEKLPVNEEITRKTIEARTALGMHLLRMLFYNKAKEAIEPITEKAITKGYRTIFPKIYTILGTYEFNSRENVYKAYQYLEDAVKIAEDLKDYPSLFIACFRLGLFYSLNCQFEKGAVYYKKAYGIAKAGNNLLGQSATKSYMCTFGYSQWGKLSLAENCAKEAILSAEESGDIYTKAMAYTAQGQSYFSMGMIEEAMKNVSLALKFSKKINFDAFTSIALFLKARIEYELNRFQDSMNHFEQSLFYCESVGGYRSWTDWLKVGVLRAKVKIENSKIKLDELYKYKHPKIAIFNGWISRYIAETLLNMDNLQISESEKWIKKAIMADEKNNMIMYLVNDHKLFSEILMRKGDKLKARQHLIKAIEIYKECGAYPRAEKAEEEL